MNFVFFMPDQQRAESVSCYGHPLTEMPSYDRLAAEGTRFENCFIQMPLCSPSRCSMMTGWYPHLRGHRTLWHLLQADEPSLFRYLKEAGYEVVVYGKNDVFSPEHAALATDRCENRPGRTHGGIPYDADHPLHYTFLAEPFPGKPEETGDMRNVHAGIEFIRSRRPGDRPFMLFLPLRMPHPEYGAPQPFHGMYDPDDVPPLRPVREDDVPAYHRLMRSYRRLDALGEDVFRRVNAIYLGMNSYVDWMLGQLLEAVDASQVAEDTTVIVAADHGDFAGDYGLVEKYHSCLLDVMVRVPLLVRAPGCAAGHAVAEPVELFDLMPTLLELAQLRARHTHFARSLVPQLRGAPGDADRRVYAEGGYNPSEEHCFEGYLPGPADHEGHIYWPQRKQFQERPESNCRTVMLRTSHWKLVRRPDGVDELYDLHNDPRETRNLYDADQQHAVRQRLNGEMLEWLIRTSDVVPQERNAREWT